MSTVKISIEIEDETLATAAKVLGTKTNTDTVHAALREVVLRQRRLAAISELTAMSDRGDFDEFSNNKASYRR